MPDLVEENRTPLAVNERREVELRYLRFDVVNYQKTLTRADIDELYAAVYEVDVQSARTGVRLREASGATQDLPCAGLFALVGLAPNSAPAPEAVQRDRRLRELDFGDVSY